jgi:hypothetical protein
MERENVTPFVVVWKKQPAKTRRRNAGPSTTVAAATFAQDDVSIYAATF